MKNFKSTILTVQSLVLILVISPSRSYATHAWGNYHWARTTTQFTLKLGNQLSSSWKSYLSQASSNWNNPAQVGASFTPVLTQIVAAGSRNCGMVSGTTQVCNKKYGNNGWLGLASIRVSGEHITHGTAKMNDSYFNLPKYGNPNEKLHVMCQEIAHTWGLDHQSEDGSSQNSCMDYFSNTDANAGSTLSTKPNYHDFEQNVIIYTHLDSFTTLASGSATSVASNASDSGDPNSWGKLISQSQSGRSSIYERANSDGSIILTHVYWTEEAASDCPGCDHRFGR